MQLPDKCVCKGKKEIKDKYQFLAWATRNIKEEMSWGQSRVMFHGKHEMSIRYPMTVIEEAVEMIQELMAEIRKK